MSTTSAETLPAGDLHRAIWRWHFYAGLFVMPLLMLMAATGGAYLFKPEIEAAIYRPMMTIVPQTTTTPPNTWARAATDAAGGRVTRVEVPARADQAARIVVDTGAGQRTVFVDPYNASVTGMLPGLGVMDAVKRIHSLVLLGDVPNMLVEVVAGWAIIMVATGLVLWWPRAGAAGAVTIRGGPRQRLFWRDLHAVTGVFAAAVVLFLAVTGMPWSAVWGDNVRKMTNAAGWGAPKPPAAAAAWSHGGHNPDAGSSPWALQGMDMHAVHHGHGPGLTLDAAIAGADAAGLARPFAVSIPEGASKAWSVSRIAERAEDLRTIYLAADDGRVLADIGWDRYGPAAKAIQWGISTHQGQEYGPANRWLMLAGCLAVWLLALSGLVMWWKRRPRGGGLAAPPRALSTQARWAALAVVVPLGILYPLTGASLIAALAVDLGLSRFRRRFHAFS
jgi:uncharacterized iron-regulated membrane protein